jgi:uncharacterized protein (TIRG00374 family)
VSTIQVPESAKPSSRRKWLTLILGLLLSIALPLLAFQGVDLSESWHLIRACNLSDLILAGFFFLATLWIRAWRWRYLLIGWKKVRGHSCLSATCVGYLANNILPFRLGDLVRVGTLARMEGIDAARVLGTIAVERVLDILTLVFFLGGYLAFAAVGPQPRELFFAGQLALGGAALISLLLLAGYWRRHAVQRLVAAPVRWLSPKLAEKISSLTGKFLEGLQAFASGWQVIQVVVLSAAMWGASVFSYHYVGRAIELELGLADYVVVVFAAAFGAIIPAAPGAVGTFHGFARLGLYLVAVRSAEAALAFAAVLHALEWGLINVAGLYFVARDRLRLLAAPSGDSDATPLVARAEAGSARYPQPV